MQRVIRNLERIPKSQGLALSVGLVLSLAVLYYRTDSFPAVSIFYFLPIAISIWSMGRKAGISVAVGSAIMLTVVDIERGVMLRDPNFTLLNEALRFLLFTLIGVMLAALKETSDHHKASARIDDLTGIPNRRAFQEFAELEIARAKRSGKPFTLAFTDIDNFKSVNDRSGHQAGDRLLSMTAAMMKTSIRETDRVARLGGDEFVIFLSETDAESAEVVMERLKQDLARMAQTHGWPISYSIGAYTFRRPPESVDEMVSRADSLMYVAKQSGKGGFLHHFE